MRDHPNENIVFVGMGTPEEAAEMKQELRSPHPFVADQDRGLYRDFNLSQGSLGQIFNPTTFARGLKAASQGRFMTRSSGDPKQLGATFVVDREGEVVWEHRAVHAADFPRASVVVEALRAADGKV